MQSPGDAVEFWISHNGRKDRYEANNVSKISRKQLKSNKQLEVKHKREAKELSRAHDLAEQKEKEYLKKRQAELDEKVKEAVSKMPLKKFIDFVASDRMCTFYTPNCGDYLPFFFYKSGYSLQCDVCGKKEHLTDEKQVQPVIKQQKVIRTMFWGLVSYNAIVHYLVDGDRQKEVDLEKLKDRSDFYRSGRHRCVHEYANF